MDYHPIEELLPKSNWSIYRLVRMAANRAAELSDGHPALIKHAREDKVTSIALEEIAQGKVVCKEVADQFAPKDTDSVDHADQPGDE